MKIWKFVIPGLHLRRILACVITTSIVVCSVFLMKLSHLMEPNHPNEGPCANVPSAASQETMDSVDFSLGNRSRWTSILAQGEAASKETMDSVDFSLGNCTNATVPSDLFIPIFIMTRDRISSFQQTLDSYQRTFTSPFEIIILDHDSTYSPMVQYLHELKMNQSITVVPLKEKNWGRGQCGGGALEEANSIIQDYLDQHPSVQFYAFTDPDIAFFRTAPDVLLFYAGLLQSCPEYNTVGPGLQISDIPSRFSKMISNGQQVFERHSPFWTDVPNIATWNGVGYHVAKHPIDTTFAMYRRNVPFKRHQGPSLRAYAPYAAVHVDWYDDSENLPADKVFYTKRQMGANNW